MTPWPGLALGEWRDTRETLHRWTQIPGKILLARTDQPCDHRRGQQSGRHEGAPSPVFLGIHR